MEGVCRMIGMKIHKAATVIEKGDVVYLKDEFVERLKNIYPRVDVVHRLKLLRQLFTYIPYTRAETPDELKQKILNFLSKDEVFTEEQLKASVGESNYVSIKEEEEFVSLLKGEKKLNG